MSDTARLNTIQRRLTRYIELFCDRVRKDLQKPYITTKTPKVKCYAEMGVSDDAPTNIGERTDDGRRLIDAEYVKETGEIIFYNCLTPDPYIKNRARHEALHFILGESGLPYADNDDIFLLLAIRYDALSYEILERPDLIELLEKGGKT